MSDSSEIQLCISSLKGQINEMRSEINSLNNRIIALEDSRLEVVVDEGMRIKSHKITLNGTAKESK